MRWSATGELFTSASVNCCTDISRRLAITQKSGAKTFEPLTIRCGLSSELQRGPAYAELAASFFGAWLHRLRSFLSPRMTPSNSWHPKVISLVEPREESGTERLSGKTALVTGSTDGVGRLVARKLGQAGARVLVHGLMRREVLKSSLTSRPVAARRISLRPCGPPLVLRLIPLRR
jgi:hypothetical protein